MELDLQPRDDNTCDVLFIYDVRDDLEHHTVLQQLKSEENLKFDYVYDDKEPGKSLFEDSDVRIPRCIVFYVSNVFCDNREMIHLSCCYAFKYGYQNKLISLVKDSSIKVYDRFLWLASSAIIYETTDGWQLQFAKELKTKTMNTFLSKPVLANTFSDKLNEIGSSLLRIKWDVHGVMVQMGEHILKIDLDIFAMHIDDHEKLNTGQVCAECPELCTLKTSVAMTLDEQKESFHIEGYAEAFSKLSSSVIDVMEAYNVKMVWGLFCTMQGKPLNDPSILKKLFHNVHYGLAEKCIRNIDKCFHPEFANEPSRLLSFDGNWPEDKHPSKEDLSKSGFFFSKLLQQPICFHCRACITVWYENDDPKIRHAGLCPFCPFVKDNLPPERIEEAKTLQERGRKPLINIYENIEERKQSFNNFDLKHLKNFENIAKDNDSIIQIIVEAGFHFYGSADMIECSFCGLRLSSFHPDRKLILLHAKLSPKCKFVLKTLGKEKVEIVFSTLEMEADEKKTEIVFLLRTLDDNPRRDLPPNIFRPVCF